jgi:hypothetical protein
MNSMMLNRTRSEERRRDTLRRICHKGIAEPASIWELLESKGIHVTPGVIYQVITDDAKQQKTTDVNRGITTSRDDEKGLSVDDVEMVASLAEKAGGVRELIRLLSTMQRVPS